MKISELVRRPATKWIVGLLLALTGVSYIDKNFFGGVLLLLAAALVLPPIYRWLSPKLPWALSRKVRGTLVAILFFAGMMMGGSRPSDVQIAASNTPTPRPSISQEPTPTPTPDLSKQSAQKELDELMALCKKANLVVSYEFSDMATVVYAGTTWYTQTVSFKKDFLAKIAILKKAITGYQHFEVRDAYSNEKVAEVTSFTGSLEVYK